MAAFSTSVPERSSRTAIRQSSSTAISAARQSGAGTTSSSISQTRSKPASYAVRTPRWKPPAPPRLSSEKVTWSGRSVRASSTARVWSVLALSMTKTASGARVCAASPSSMPTSRSARLKVTHDDRRRSRSHPSRQEPPVALEVAGDAGAHGARR